jgi:hypothetical protein
MRPIKPNKTESTFSSNKEVKRNATGEDWKRDGTVKDVSIALYDVDYAVKWHLENVINPTCIEDNAVITVPILFAAGEKWASVQKHGYLRDNQGKILTPMIMIKRNSVSKREDIQDLKVLETADARITFERKYTKANRYDRFSLSQASPVKEFYSIDVPKFVQIEYELLIWTNNSIQLNEVVEQLIWFDGKAFGDAHKFITHIDPPSFESVNANGEDRIVRATMGMRTKAHILNTHGPNAPAMYKLNPVNKIVTALEVDTAIEKTTSSTGQSPKIIISSPSIAGGSRASTPANVNAALIYINSNTQKTGTVTSATSATFAAGWLAAPSGLPNTSIDNFVFYVNGVLLERTAIVSFTQSGNVSTLIIDVAQLGYGFDGSAPEPDEIIAIGKFS